MATKRKPLAKGTKIAIGVGVILLLGGLAYYLWKRRQQPQLPQEDLDQKLKDVFNNLNFQTGKDVILATSFPYLDELADVLLKPKAKDWTVKIIGHTDSQGKETYNLDLSQRRANSVRRYLVGKGVDETRITTEGKGESQPLVGNDTESGRAMNRRVEFIIQKPDLTTVATTETTPPATGTVTPPATVTTPPPATGTATPPATNTGVTQ